MQKIRGSIGRLLQTWPPGKRIEFTSATDRSLMWEKGPNKIQTAGYKIPHTISHFVEKLPKWSNGFEFLSWSTEMMTKAPNTLTWLIT